MLASGCEEKGAGPSGQLTARLVIQARVVRDSARLEDRTLEVAVAYLQSPTGGGTPVEVPLATASVAISSGGTVTVPVVIDLGPCLADDRRASTDESCPLIVSLALKVGTLILDAIRIGPINAVAGVATELPNEVVLHEVAELRLSWPGSTSGASGDTLRAGRTLQLTATPADAGGGAVGGRDVQWSSSAPAVASVDAASGVITPLGPGTATITASAGGRTADFSAHVYAAAQQTQVVAGDGQRLAPGGTVTSAPTVRVTDLSGRPAEAVTVSFAISGGGGTVAGPLTQRTDVLGEARPGNWTLGAAPAVNTLQAMVLGTVLAPVTITSYGTIAPVHDLLAAGSFHACLIGADAITRCWGTNDGRSELGDSGAVGVFGRVAVRGSPAFVILRALGAGQHTCGQTASGSVLCWGRNHDGAARGDGTLAVAVLVPTLLGGGPYSAISPGLLTTCGLTPSNSAVCWGINQAGEVGDGTSGTPRITPVPVATALQFTSIEAGWIHSCAVTASGAAHCWGRGRLVGTGATVDVLTPAPVVGGHSFARLYAGSNHTCGLTAIGEAWCWGSNNLGQLGNGATTGADGPPVPVTGGLFFGMLAAGSVPNGSTIHTCGLTITGQAYCWGDNTFGQLGDGTTTNRLVPTPVLSTQVFVAIDAGNGYSCAMTAARQVYCWGSNAFGLFGSGVAGGISTTPVLVP